MQIRAAGRADAELIVSLIRELAEYERAPEKALATVEQIDRWLFGPDPACEALIAEVDGQPAGFALFYRSFSTWEATPGLWLEDLFVRPDHRRAGIGLALMNHLASITRARGYARLEWTALNWNTPALAFYERLGAEAMSEWQMLRLDGERLVQAASVSPA